MKKLFFVLLSILFCGQFAFAKSPKTMNVMTFNVRLVSTSDGVNEWKYRKNDAVGLLKYHCPDIWGGQEVTHPQLTDILNDMPEFGYIGVGRADGKTQGEYAPIFYRKDRFEVVDHGDFWLAEKDKMYTPGVKGWDAACERVATWGIFKDKNTGKKFFMLNTHLDHMGPQARHNGAALVVEQAAKLSKGLPVIVTGDFNAQPDDEPIQVLLDKNNSNALQHTRDLAPFTYGPKWTYHDFGRLPIASRTFIDYVMVRGNWNVLSHAVLSDYMGEIFPSDHCPVIVKMEMK